MVFTLVCWATLIKGLLFLFLPSGVELEMNPQESAPRNPLLFYVWMTPSLLIGIYLTYGGIPSRERHGSRPAVVDADLSFVRRSLLETPAGSEALQAPHQTSSVALKRGINEAQFDDLAGLLIRWCLYAINWKCRLKQLPLRM